MLTSQCLKIPIRAGRTGELTTWIASLRDRRAEVLDALVAEGIADEAVFVAEEEQGDFLYLYSRAADLEAAAAAFATSTRPVDVEFREVLARCLDFAHAQPLRLVFAADAERGDVQVTD